MKNYRMLVYVMMVFALILSACSNNNSSGTNAKGSVNAPAASGVDARSGSGEPTELLIALEQEPVGYDANKMSATSSVRIYAQVYDTLTEVDADYNLKPGLAEKWELSEDGKTLTFTLQQNVKWHNGREFTSEDVKFAIERILNPDNGALLKSSFDSIETIETPDPLTVVLKLKYSDSAILYNFAHWFASIMPKEVTDPSKEAMGTGPYKLDNVKPGQSITLKKNTDYFKEDLPKIDTITYRIMKDEAERLAAIRSGKIDVTIVNNESAQLLETTKNVSIAGFQSMEIGYIGLNVAKKPFDDPRVRQAISYAVNRDEIISTVYKGEAVVTGPISPAQKGYALDPSEFASYKHDIEKAKQLLKEAGYENGFNTVIQTQALYPTLVDSSVVIQQQLKEIGINAEIKKMEDAPFIELWRSKKMDVIVGRNPSATNPDRNTRFYFHTDGGANVWNYSNLEYDKIVMQALEETDEAKRKELYKQAQIMLVEDSPNIFLASPKVFYAYGSKVKDFVPTAAGEAQALRMASMSE
jgi:peptide/nickel transport system substrate-binding protein